MSNGKAGKATDEKDSKSKSNKKSKKTDKNASSSDADNNLLVVRGLHTNVCVSGWLHEKCDFQRPWGVMGTDPAMKEKVEVLQRFLAVHNPAAVNQAKDMLKDHKKQEDELWKSLKTEYGKDPDHLVPFQKLEDYCCAVVDYDLQRTIMDVMAMEVLPDESSTALDSVYQENMMLVQMEAKNVEVMDYYYDMLEALKEMEEEERRREAEANGQDPDGNENDDGEDRDDLDASSGSSASSSSASSSGSSIDEVVVQDGEVVILKKKKKNKDNETGGSNGRNGHDDLDASTASTATSRSTFRSYLTSAVYAVPNMSARLLYSSSKTKTTTTEDTDTATSTATSTTGSSPSTVAPVPEQTVVETVTDSPDAASVPGTTTRPTEQPRPKPARSMSSRSMTEYLTYMAVKPLVGLKGKKKKAAPQRSIGFDLTQILAAKAREALHNNGQKTEDQTVLEEGQNGTGKDGDEDIVAAPPTTEVTIEESAKKDDHDMVVWDWEGSFNGDMYTLTWETELLTRLCRVVNLLFVEIGAQVSRELAKQTMIGGVVAAVAIPSALMTASNIIDDPYQMISNRSDYAGVELARCLLKTDEHRPVTLVGFSFGARVIFSCIRELARHQLLWEEQQRFNDLPEDVKISLKKKYRRRRARQMQYKREPASIVEDAVFIGMPRLLDLKEWVKCREIIGGRVVNCYNRSDWFLSYLFQIRCMQGVSRWTAGTHPVEGVDGVENHDITEFVSTHGRYPLIVPQILHRIGLGQPRGMVHCFGGVPSESDSEGAQDADGKPKAGPADSNPVT